MDSSSIVVPKQDSLATRYIPKWMYFAGATVALILFWLIVFIVILIVYSLVMGEGMVNVTGNSRNNIKREVALSHTGAEGMSNETPVFTGYSDAHSQRLSVAKAKHAKATVNTGSAENMNKYDDKMLGALL